MIVLLPAFMIRSGPPECFETSPAIASTKTVREYSVTLETFPVLERRTPRSEKICSRRLQTAGFERDAAHAETRTEVAPQCFRQRRARAGGVLKLRREKADHPARETRHRRR